jgi:hypothetical protein
MSSTSCCAADANILTVVVNSVVVQDLSRSKLKISGFLNIFKIKTSRLSSSNHLSVWFIIFPLIPLFNFYFILLFCCCYFHLFIFGFFSLFYMYLNFFIHILYLILIFLLFSCSVVVAEVCWGQSFGRNFRANAECTRSLRKACGADVMRQAEESGGALAESQAFLGKGKRGLSGRKCTRFRGADCGNPGAGGRWGFTANCGVGVQRILRRGYKERGH